MCLVVGDAPGPILEKMRPALFLACVASCACALRVPVVLSGARASRVSARTCASGLTGRSRPLRGVEGFAVTRRAVPVALLPVAIAVRVFPVAGVVVATASAVVARRASRRRSAARQAFALEFGVSEASAEIKPKFVWHPAGRCPDESLVWRVSEHHGVWNME